MCLCVCLFICKYIYILRVYMFIYELYLFLDRYFRCMSCSIHNSSVIRSRKESVVWLKNAYIQYNNLRLVKIIMLIIECMNKVGDDHQIVTIQI